MKTTELAKKKMDQICGNEHAQKELIFSNNFLLTGFARSIGRHSLFLCDIPSFVKKCNDFEIRIIGFEVNLDSVYHFHVLTWEDYFSSYFKDWVFLAIDDLKSAGISQDIVPTIDIPSLILKKYV